MLRHDGQYKRYSDRVYNAHLLLNVNYMLFSSLPVYTSFKQIPLANTCKYAHYSRIYRIFHLSQSLFVIYCYKYKNDTFSVSQYFQRIYEYIES